MRLDLCDPHELGPGFVIGIEKRLRLRGRRQEWVGREAVQEFLAILAAGDLVEPLVKLIDDRLQCGGPIEAFAGRIERFLRARARDRLSQVTEEMAQKAGVTVRSVSVGDAGNRWGSCSTSGAIRYSWRIILAPPHLLRWLVANEVSHRRHMNHGPEFRALEAQLYEGNVAAARAELMGYPGVSLIGHVESINRGIADNNTAPNPQGLPEVNPVFTWVRLAQRIPVRIHIDKVPDNVHLAIGETCTVNIERSRD